MNLFFYVEAIFNAFLNFKDNFLGQSPEGIATCLSPTRVRGRTGALRPFFSGAAMRYVADAVYETETHFFYLRHSKRWHPVRRTTIQASLSRFCCSRSLFHPHPNARNHNSHNIIPTEAVRHNS